MSYILSWSSVKKSQIYTYVNLGTWEEKRSNFIQAGESIFHKLISLRLPSFPWNLCYFVNPSQYRTLPGALLSLYLFSMNFKKLKKQRHVRRNLICVPQIEKRACHKLWARRANAQAADALFSPRDQLSAPTPTHPPASIPIERANFCTPAAELRSPHPSPAAAFKMRNSTSICTRGCGARSLDLITHAPRAPANLPECKVAKKKVAAALICITWRAVENVTGAKSFLQISN